jgi:hypothetical protein
VRRVGLVLLLATLALLMAGEARSQSARPGRVDAELAFAGRLLDDGDFPSAAVEFQRVLVAELDDSVAFRAWTGLALSQFSAGSPEQAGLALRVAEDRAPTTRLRDETRITRGTMDLAAGNTAQATLQFLEMEETAEDPGIRSRARFLAGVGTARLHRWAQARELFTRFFSETPPADSAEFRRLDRLLAHAAKHREKSSAVAKRLSTLLPGTGQFYAGDWLNGLNAMVLNGVTGYWLVGSVQDGAAADAVLKAVLVLSRYYLGNRYQAGVRTERRNDRDADRLSVEVDRLSQAAVGSAPPAP